MVRNRFLTILAVLCLPLFSVAATAPASLQNDPTKPFIRVSYAAQGGVAVNIAQNAVAYKAGQPKPFPIPDAVYIHLANGRQQKYDVSTFSYDLATGEADLTGSGQYGTAVAQFETDVNSQTGEVSTETTYTVDGVIKVDKDSIKLKASSIHLGDATKAPQPDKQP